MNTTKIVKWLHPAKKPYNTKVLKYKHTFYTIKAHKRYLIFITACKWSCGKVMFSEVFVCPQGVSVCPGVCPGRGSLSREGVSVQGGSLYPGRWSLSRRPPYGCVWAVCILLECILLPIRFKYYTLKFTLMHELSHFGLETLIRLRLYA